MSRSALLAMAERLEHEAAMARTLAATYPDDAAIDPAPDDDGDLLDTATAAERFNCPPDTIRNWCRDHGIGERQGGRWMISTGRLRRFLADRR